MPKGHLLATLAILLAAAAAFVIPTVWFKPWSIDHFYARTFLAFALRHPMMLSSLRVLEPMGLDFHSNDLDEASIEFRRRLGVEISFHDHARFEASTDGIAWTTIWNHAGVAIDESSWSLQSYDISAIADHKAAVRFRWVMGTTNGSVTYPGWNLDDIRIWGVLPQAECVASPGEVESVRFLSDGQTMVWERPADMGGPIVPVYDVLRSDDPGVAATPRAMQATNT